jgi:hypothetical protein
LAFTVNELVTRRGFYLEMETTWNKVGTVPGKDPRFLVNGYKSTPSLMFDGVLGSSVMKVLFAHCL